MENVEEENETNVVTFAKHMLSGKYTYLTYLILSSTCFFFWMTPNCHLLRRFFTKSNNMQMHQ